MSIQTDSRIEEGKQKGILITTGEDRETGKHHGLLYVNHPTPSGCDRWMMALSDNRGWDNKETARAEFEKLLPTETLEAAAKQAKGES